MGRVGDSCWTKVPYASIFAFLVLIAGIGCFCGPFYMGLEALEQFVRRRDTFNLNEADQILWMGELKIVLTIMGAATGVIGVLLVVFGALTTGATRRNVYSGASCILGGRCSAVFFMLLTYVLNFVWMAITSSMAVPVILFVMLKSICDTEYAYQQYQPGVNGRALFCFNLTKLGLYFPGYNKEFKDDFWHGPAICQQTILTEMCSVVEKEIPLMSVGFAGSFLIVVSLVSFLMIISANYQRIKTAKELTDYREALEQDNTEMDNIITSRRPFNSSYASESVLS